MKHDYIFYTTDDSFDYGDRTWYETGYHGFCIDIDKNDNICMSSLKGYGEFYDIEECKTYKDLYNYIDKHEDYITEWSPEDFNNAEIFEELKSILLVKWLKEENSELKKRVEELEKRVA